MEFTKGLEQTVSCVVLYLVGHFYSDQTALFSEFKIKLSEIPEPFVCLLEVNFGVLWGIIGAKKHYSIFYINSFLFVETDEREKKTSLFS